jgi:hypothetical protein
MRTRIILPALVIAIAAAAWFHARSSARELQAQLDLLHEHRRELLALQSERAHLHESIAAVDAAAAQREHSLEAPAIAKPVPAAPPFALGEWTPSAAWSNSGQATPRDALKTALWAAAGGDAMAMQLLLEIDPAARSKAEKLLDQLSPAARSSFVTPEALIANVTMKIIPPTQAQIAWYHESDPDHAAIGVLFAMPETSPEPVVKMPAGKQDNSPPSLSDNRTSKMALLAMHRTSSGWRLVVPASAVDRIAAEIGVPKK